MQYCDDSFSLESTGSLIMILDLDISVFRQLTYMGGLPATYDDFE